jgi:hypothetical protein
VLAGEFQCCSRYVGRGPHVRAQDSYLAPY